MTTVTPKKRSMARKTSDVPTRIYAYRCLPPVTEQQRVEDQFRLAHQYRNALVEIEHRLRGRLRDVQLGVAPVALALRLYEDANAGVDNAYDELRMAKSGTATPNLDEPRKHLEALQELRALRTNELREIKRNHDADLAPGYQASREEAHRERLRARADFGARGLRHGTYIRIEDAIKQAAKSTKRPLRFERYDGTGSIGTQLLETSRSNGVRGMTVRELHSLQDTRLRVQALPDNYWQLPRNRRRHAARVHAWLRIGSNPDRSPIFAEFPITMHRPLPKDAVIKWAYIVRKRIGHHFEWSLQLTIESETFRTPHQAVGEGACAIDLGWRRLFDDQGEMIGLRAGYLVDDTGSEREILVPEKTWRRMPKVHDLQKIRDESLERAQFQLSDWLALAREQLPQSWTEAEGSERSMLERLQGYSQWRSSLRLRAFINRWQDRRVDGDDEIYAAMQAWAKQDRHLQSWQEHQRTRLIEHRREEWRVIATKIARKYAVILLEDHGDKDQSLMKLPEIDGWEQPDPAYGDPSDNREQRRMARLATPGGLRAEIIKAATKTGARVETARAAYSTQECTHCGHLAEFDARAQLTHQCVSCLREWDQDANACRNLLKRNGYASGSTPPLPPEVLASSNSPGSPMIQRSKSATTYADDRR